MSSSESSYTWDDWYNRHNPNNEKNRRLDKQHHEVAVLKQQRDELLAELRATESRLHEVSVFCATIEQQHNQLLGALIGLLCEAEVIARVMPAYGESQNIKNARAAIAKAKGAV